MNILNYISILKKSINLIFPTVFNSPLVLHISITNKCNSNCLHCDIWKNKDKTDLTFSSFRQLVDQASTLGLKFVTLTGGEPFMHKDFFRMLKYLKKKKLYVNISSNGSMINETNAEKLKEIEVDSVIISLDGTTNSHNKQRGQNNSFYSAINSIQLLNKYKVRTDIGFCMTKNNYNDIPAFLKLIDKYSIHNLYLYPFYLNPTNLSNKTINEWKNKDQKFFTNEQLNELKHIFNSSNFKSRFDKIDSLFFKKLIKFNSGEDIPLEEFPCHAPLISSIINCNGDILPCWTSSVKIGNIYTDRFDKIWHSKKYKEIRNKIRKNKCDVKNVNCFCSTHRLTSARINLLFRLKVMLGFV